jgi:DNA-binding NarL/FixJ family response regulator
MNQVRIIIADDHALVRNGLRALLSAVDGFEVVGEAANGRDAVRLVRELAPDIALLDVTMPELNGIEAAASIARDGPSGTRSVMLSMHSGGGYVRAAFAAGASGFVLKESGIDELEHALRVVAGGQRYVAPSLSRCLEHAEAGKVSDRPPLTPRQREVLQLIAEGHSTRGIADKLGLSVKTIETHRAQIMERLGIRDVASLTRYALREGMVGPY